MLTTQVSGLLQRISSNGEEAIEETARLLAQATLGEGRIIIAGFGEMDVIPTAAQYSAEPFLGIIRYKEGMNLTKADRVWILTRTETDDDALKLANRLANQFIPFAAIASGKPDETNELANLAYTYISTGLTRGLLPSDSGERIVQPHAFAALFIYEAVKVAYDEMLSDEDE
ncbi:DUF2529 family protein [Sporosarcina sp. G11-34]|uniref:DUF2529 family protein n=1 Tax=Sporosarcina sp. G11-34 TaxID=2849605 RepID=UPI002E7A7152|nr:DUF2529 family protein [Sporosarcina sp. G11-34]